MPGSRVWGPLVVGLLLLGGGSVPAAGAPVGPAAPTGPVVVGPVEPSYGFYAPYASSRSSVLPAPSGFAPFYLESVGRHGSRATVSSSSMTTVRTLCATATEGQELTTLGAGFCADAELLGARMRTVGYGDLSPLGEQQWEDIGARVADDHRAFFAAARKAEAPIRFVSSHVDRAQDSSDAFRTGLRSTTSGLKLKKRTTDDDLLHFSTPRSTTGQAEIDRIEHSDATRAAAASTLQRLFGGRSDDLDDARDVWDLYAIAPGMGMHLDAYLSAADAAQLAYLDDAETFYRYGPGVEGTRGFASAEDLRDDLLAVIDDHRHGSRTMATFRHGHAETIAPLAALLRLGPTSAQVTPELPFTDRAPGWQGDQDVAMAANLDLAAYKKGKTVLVTVRHNERPVTVTGCRASRYGAYFYDLDTLRACWS